MVTMSPRRFSWVLAVALLAGCGEQGTPADAGADASPVTSDTREAWERDPAVREMRSLVWEGRRNPEKLKETIRKEAPATAACQIKQTHVGANGKTSQFFSWSKSDQLEAAKWVYFDAQGNRRLVLTTWRHGKSILEARLYLRADGSEVHFEQTWMSRDIPLPDWKITREEVLKPWVPGC
jgi:hypothetical protein